MFHYPNHVLRPSIFSKIDWPNPRQQKGSTYEMAFTVENVEIFKRRKKCKKWVNYDENVMDIMIRKVGCSPPYYSKKTGVPVCTTARQLKDMASNIVLGTDHGIEPPCKSLESMTYSYSEIDYKGSIYDTVADFWVYMEIPNPVFKVRHGN